MNAVGTMGDVFTLLHEAGHSFHQFLMQEHSITSYRDINAEIAEGSRRAVEEGECRSCSCAEEEG